MLRVYIDPATFPDWCVAHGTSPGSTGRRKFVAAAVTESMADRPDQHRYRFTRKYNIEQHVQFGDDSGSAAPYHGRLGHILCANFLKGP